MRFEELRADVDYLLEHAPTGREATLDREGRPAYGQQFARNPYVFIKLEDDLYSLRRVATVERPSKDIVAVIEGLRPNELVVATGAFTVMSEFLKSRLGAGCVDD